MNLERRTFPIQETLDLVLLNILISVLDMTLTLVSLVWISIAFWEELEEEFQKERRREQELEDNN